MKSARLRLFRVNCRSERQFDAEPARPPLTGGHPPFDALVAEGEAFDDLDPPVPRGADFDRAAASGVEAIVATARGRAMERVQCR